MSFRRPINSDFWTDAKVVNSFTPEDKLFMLYLLTNPHMEPIGIYPFIPKIAAFEIGYSIEAVNTLLERFESKYEIVRYNESTGEIAVRNYLRHSISKGGKPVADMLNKSIQQVRDKSLIDYVFNAASADESTNETVRSVIESYYESLHESSTNRERYADYRYSNSYSNSIDVVGTNKEADDDGTVNTLERYATANLQYCSPGNLEELITYRDSMDDDAIRYCIDLACANGSRKYSYVRRILNNCVDQGLRTVGDIKAREAEREREKTGGKPPSTFEGKWY